MCRVEKLHSSHAGLGLVCGRLPGKAGVVRWTLMCGWTGKRPGRVNKQRDCVTRAWRHGYKSVLLPGD